MKAKWKTNIKILDLNKYNIPMIALNVNKLDIPYKRLR